MVLRALDFVVDVWHAGVRAGNTLPWHPWTIFRGGALFWTFCLILRYLLPLLVVFGVFVRSGGSTVAAEGPEVAIAFHMTPTERAKLEAAKGLSAVEWRFEERAYRDGIDGCPDADGRGPIVVHSDPKLGLAFAIVDRSPCGARRMRLNVNNGWTTWDIVHELEHWRLGDPDLWGGLYFLVDATFAHDVKLFWASLFWGADWLFLSVWLGLMNWWLRKPCPQRGLWSALRI
jgi:hypothetical protein